jgi:hypothetical protein
LIRIVKLYKNAILARENREQNLRQKERQASIERRQKEQEYEEQREKNMNDDTATINTGVNIDGAQTSSPMSICH